MKKLFLIIILINFINCEKDGSTKEMIFDSQKLPQLLLQDVGSFWNDDSIKHISDYMGAAFEDHSGFIDGVRYDGDKKMIGVSVFKSQASAIEAMEKRRNNVAALIIEGEKHELIKGKWWFTDNIPNAVFANQWNAIIEVGYYHSDYQAVKTLLIETAAEIARRIDSSSE